MSGHRSVFDKGHNPLGLDIPEGIVNRCQKKKLLNDSDDVGGDHPVVIDSLLSRPLDGPGANYGTNYHDPECGKHIKHAKQKDHRREYAEGDPAHPIQPSKEQPGNEQGRRVEKDVPRELSGDSLVEAISAPQRSTPSLCLE
jgi:hypothetical protein